jgi:general secretion pathway protein D
MSISNRMSTSNEMAVELVPRFRLAVLMAVLLCVAGCHRGGADFNAGRRAEAIQDYDTALIHYERALQADPGNTEYKLKAMRLRFEAGQYHVEQGQKIRQAGDLQMALAEFQKALMIDPASAIAQQETQNTMNAMADRQAASQARPAPQAPAEAAPRVMAGPPQLMPLSRSPINLTMTNDVKLIFEAVGRYAGLTVLFDPDYASRRISIELNNVTLEQALDVVSLEGKAFWKPVTNNIIFVAPDQAQKRRDYEEYMVKTIYLGNTILPQELTEIINVLRQLLDLRRIQQFNSQNAIVVRDTPDKIMLIEKIINDLDKAKPEVLIQFAVLQARRDRLRDLGISPGTTAALAFTPAGSSSSTSTSTTSPTSIPLNELRTLSTADYSITLPGATATALLTDSQTQIIDDPSIRVVDGQAAKLRIGDRVPVATGSFQAGVGVGAAGAAGGVINPLVNTQFTYQEVGVNIDVTPRVHLNNEVSLNLVIEVSSVSGTSNIGGINQPIISTNSVSHPVRLRDGEVNILGGLIRNSQTKSVTGLPGLSQIPFLRYFFSSEHVQDTESEILIVVIPHVIRKLNLTAENLRSIASGTDTNPAIRLDTEVLAPQAVPAPAAPVPPASGAPAPGPGAQAAPAAPQGQMARLSFQPDDAAVRVGETVIIGLAVQDAQDLFSIPVLLQYNPAVVAVEDVRQGGFLSGGTQPVAIVQRVDRERGQAIISATRMPNTPGISGSGTIFGIVVRGVAPGSSSLSILQVNARDSQQRALPLITSEATLNVAP